MLDEKDVETIRNIVREEIVAQKKAVLDSLTDMIFIELKKDEIRREET